MDRLKLTMQRLMRQVLGLSQHGSEGLGVGADTEVPASLLFGEVVPPVRMQRAVPRTQHDEVRTLGARQGFQEACLAVHVARCRIKRESRMRRAPWFMKK